jgi:hypothetical protein
MYALITCGSVLRWYQNGKLHRNHDMPAYIYYGYNIWYNNGVYYRKHPK